MLATQAYYLKQLPSNSMSTFLGKSYAVWDWARLGIFTGSNLSEYVQRKHQRFHTIPINHDTGTWGGKQLAFVPSNFVFYDALLRLIPHSTISRHHQLGQVTTLHI
jgi:hypothetical protein